MSDYSCGYHYYTNISQTKINKIVSTLNTYDISITGSNPWMVTPDIFGIELQGIWDSINQVLYIVVMDKDSFVPCGKLWELIDPVIEHISDLSDGEVN